MNRLEAIEARISVRSYTGEALGLDEVEGIRATIAERMKDRTPFGSAVRLGLALGGEARQSAIGTYGFIRGAVAFLVAAAPKGPRALEDIGYVLEGAVLDLTSMDLGTCWIGGLFTRSRAAEIVNASNGDFVPVVIAVGRPADKRSAIDRLVTGAARSRSRKPLADIVYDAADGFGGANGPDTPARLLEALRAAPSASNKQPWRLVRAGRPGCWMLFLDEDKVYNSALGEVRIQNIDMGIAMRHFAEAARELGYPGRWLTPSESDAEEFSAGMSFGAAKGWKPVAVWMN